MYMKKKLPCGLEGFQPLLAFCIVGTLHPPGSFAISPGNQLDARLAELDNLNIQRLKG